MSSMQLNIRIQDESFKVSIGKGYNDWVWLTHYASRVYAKSIYPQGTYLPSFLYLEQTDKQIELHPHPRQKISTYLQKVSAKPQNIVCHVKIRKANYSLNQYEKNWQRNAFEKMKYFMTCSFSYQMINFNRKKDFYLKVKTYYIMSDQIKHVFNQKQFPNLVETILKQKQIGPAQSKFQSTFQIPLGTVSHKLFYYERDLPTEEYNEIELTQKKYKKQDFVIKVQPIYFPLDKINLLVEQDMKIQDDINKTLQQKQIQTKKRNASSSLCCYTFEQLWQILSSQYKEELSLQDYEPSTIERIKLVLQKTLNPLYEIFFYYFIVENQQKDKKQDLGIIYQDFMHFLRDYQVLSDMNHLANFIQFYNQDGKFQNIQDTLDINNHFIRFPQFVVILLRSVQFVQTSTFLMKGQTFDSAVVKILQRIAQIDTQQDQFTQFRRNLRSNPKIISFIRASSQKIKQIFTWMSKRSIQNSSSNYVIMKEQIKQLLINFSLTQSNIDKIVSQCFKELRLNQNGIFYYQFLVVIEWLSMAIVGGQKDQEQQAQNQQQQAMMIVQKMKYFLDKIDLNK